MKKKVGKKTDVRKPALLPEHQTSTHKYIHQPFKKKTHSPTLKLQNQVNPTTPTPLTNSKNNKEKT